MKPLLTILAALALPCFGQAQSPLTQAQLTKLLTFEDEHTGSLPAGWSGGPVGTITADDRIRHGGKWSARLERSADSAQTFSTITKVIPITFTGSGSNFAVTCEPKT